MSNDWMGKLSKFGNELAAGIQDTGKLMKSDFEKARGQVQEQSAQSDAARQAAEQHRWERKASPTWAAPTEACGHDGVGHVRARGPAVVAGRRHLPPPGGLAGRGIRDVAGRVRGCRRSTRSVRARLTSRASPSVSRAWTS